jgi:polyisoprenyl-phosphate glycosyltransferase
VEALRVMPPGGFDFRLIDRKVIDTVTHIDERNTSLMGVVLWSGFRRAEIAYTRRAREKGRSMWTLAEKLDEAARRPLHVADRVVRGRG